MSDVTSEKRKYFRVAQKIPVDFSVMDEQDILLPGVGSQKGHTVNVSKGGVCLETHTLSESTIKYLNQQHILLVLKFHLPLSQRPVNAIAQISWYEKKETPSGVRYVLGLKYRSVKADDALTLLRQSARFKFLLYAVLILTAFFLCNILYHFIITKP
ncbi:MAG: PilZ domain-containing protein [Candidatus Omnitrophota bacterium]